MVQQKAEAVTSALSKEENSRYLEKISLIGGVDPYSLQKREHDGDVEMHPKITYPDIVNYLILTISAYTMDDLKNYKSLNAYNQFVSGWIKEICIKSYENFGQVLLFGKVWHSQKLNEAPLRPRTICELNGKIRACHCNPGLQL